MALKIGLSSFVSAGFLNPVIWRLYEDVSGVLIDEHQEIGPHGVIYNFAFTNNIRDIAYRIEFYNQPGGVGIGNLIKSHVVTPSTQTLILDTDIELIVDGPEVYDPVSGTSSVIVPATIGKSCYLEKRGIGKLFETRGIEATHDQTTGQFDLLDDATFDADDRYVVKIRPQIVVNPPGSQGASSIYKAVELVTADRLLSSADFGKLLIVEGAAAVIRLKLPAKATIIEKVSLFVRSMGLNTGHKTVNIEAADGETIFATGESSLTFLLGRAEEAEIIKLGDDLYGFTDSQDIKRAGQIDWSYSVGLNRLWADGTEYDVADYPRVKKAMDALKVGDVVTYAQWATQVTLNGVNVFPWKGKFALSGDGTKFKVPDFRDKSVRALRYSDNTVDTERMTTGSGAYQHYKPGKHFHFSFNGHSDTTGNGLSADNYPDFQGEQGGTGDFKYSIRGSGNVAVIGRTSNGKVVRIGTATEDADDSNRENNIGLIPQIIT